LAVSAQRLTTFRRLAETLVIGAAGGLALGLTGVPGGYLSGSILLVSAAALAGRPMLIPLPLMRVLFVLLGASLGAVVTPETLHGMLTYPLSIVVLLVAMSCIGVCCARYLETVHGWNRLSAYLASAPGGMSQVLAVAAEMGADLRAIAIVQSMRVVIIAVGLPSGLALLGLVGHIVRPPSPPLTLESLDELAILLAASSVGAYVAQKVRMPGGLLFGAMFTSAGLHGSALIDVAMPWWVTNTAAIALGAIIGARFANMRFRLFVSYIGAAFGSMAIAIAIAGAFAAGLRLLLKLPLAELVIAFAPGSVDAMMLLALALHLDPVYVGAHHVVRILFVGLAMPLLARHEAQRQAKPAPGE
jgi:membrane AbrB-like protein